MRYLPTPSSFASLAATKCRPWQLLLFSAVMARVAMAKPADNEPMGYVAWPKWALVVFCLVTVVLSAMYCGLTIGLLGMETIYLEIIADAGQEPDRTYARQILPVRKLGHQLLATLLLGNMLTLVLTSQLVAAIVNGSEIVNFVVGTLVVLIFGEILPMSFCNNQNNALFAGAKSLSALKVSLLVLYPIAKPLGMMLDCMVGHDAGQVYDRNELKELIRVHCEKFSDKSGIDKDQVRMMLSAMDMNEVTVDAAMTPLNKAVMLEAEAVLDTALERRLWEYGISRIPVYQNTRANIIGVLYVKDLIDNSYLGRDNDMTVRDFIVQHPRDLLVVKADTLLQDMLYIFEHRHTQLLFVEPSAPNDSTQDGPGNGEVGANTSPLGKDYGSGSNPRGTASSSKALPVEKHVYGSDGSPVKPAGASTSVARHHRLHGRRESTRGGTEVNTPVALLSDGAERRTFVGIVTLEDVIEELIGSEIYDEDEYSASDVTEEETLEATGLEPAPPRPPRVNFYSYGVQMNADGTPNSLFDDQLWGLASYLTRAYVFFATWSVAHVKFLLDQVGDCVVQVNEVEREGNDQQTRNSAALTAVMQRDINTIDQRRVLYRAGQPSTVFTLLLSGGVAVSVGCEKITTELRSFSGLGEEVLMGDSPFQPDYTAIVSRTSRFIRITPLDITVAERKLNELRARRRQKPVRLSAALTTEVEVPVSVPLPTAATSQLSKAMRREGQRVATE
jgi:CBS domain containing-hemolysin-like protein